MAICPRGHNSVDEAFCDTCRAPIEGQGMQQFGGLDYGQGPAELCPVCRTRRDSSARFCEACRHEFGTTPAPLQPEYPPPGPQPGGYDPSGYPGQSGQSVQSGQSGRSIQTGQSVQTGHDQYGYSDQGYAPQPIPGQPVPGQTTHGYAPAYPAPVDPQPGYPPADPHPGYPNPVYPDEYGDGTVMGQGQVVVPPPPGVPQQLQTQPQYVWTLRVTADRDYFDRVVAQGGPDAHAMRFPDYHEPWEVVLHGDTVRVGRRRAAGNATDIEVDLSGPPSDPGISHHHVSLRRDPEGTWSVVDEGSTNGTTINGGLEAIDLGIPVRLQEGDRMHVGAWTTLEVRLTALH